MKKANANGFPMNDEDSWSDDSSDDDMFGVTTFLSIFL